jgi:hypothetical protein
MNLDDNKIVKNKQSVRYHRSIIELNFKEF